MYYTRLFQLLGLCLITLYSQELKAQSDSIQLDSLVTYFYATNAIDSFAMERISLRYNADSLVVRKTKKVSDDGMNWYPALIKDYQYQQKELERVVFFQQNALDSPSLKVRIDSFFHPDAQADSIVRYDSLNTSWHLKSIIVNRQSDSSSSTLLLEADDTGNIDSILSDTFINYEKNGRDWEYHALYNKNFQGDFGLRLRRNARLAQNSHPIEALNYDRIYRANVSSFGGAMRMDTNMIVDHDSTIVLLSWLGTKDFGVFSRDSHVFYLENDTIDSSYHNYWYQNRGYYVAFKHYYSYAQNVYRLSAWETYRLNFTDSTFQLYERLLFSYGPIDQYFDTAFYENSFGGFEGTEKVAWKFGSENKVQWIELYEYESFSDSFELTEKTYYYYGTPATNLKPQRFEAGLAVYPNPADKHVNITGIQPNERVILYDLFGKQITSRVGNGLLEFEEVAPGTYILKSESGKESKLIIRR